MLLYGLISLVCTKATTILTKSPDGEQVTVVGVVEEKGAVEASNVFLSSKTQVQSTKPLRPLIIKYPHIINNAKTW